jgi:ABC-2 type transport system permease protein
LAKYFGGLTLVIFTLLPTLVYFISVYQLGNPVGNIDTGSVWGSYIGLTLLGASFVSIGIFCSAITNNQIISFIVAVFLSWGLWVGLETIASFQFLGTWDHLLLSIGINSHYSSLSRGVIDTRDVVYLISVIAVFVVLTRTVLESRKW